jgi:6-phosphogluconolactonase (cycloisomerase 2 family)
MRLMSSIWPRAAALVVALGGVFGVGLTAGASAHGLDVAGHVYINDNTAGTNTIAAFDRHADGTLTPVPGSPFPAGGAGTGSGIGSQGALQATDDGRYLLAVDAGSNEISVLRIEHDGGLHLAHRGVVDSGGLEPVSIAVNDDLVYVANAGTGGSNYTGFRLHRHGRLEPLPGSTFPLPDGSQPGDVLFNSRGTNLIGARVGTSLIDSFRVRFDGRIVPAAGSPFAAQGPGPFGSEFRPTNPHQLFVSNAHGGTNNGTVSAFQVGFDGTLASIGGSPFADLQTAPCWVEISHDGRFLFTVNTASGSISRYVIRLDGSLALIGSTPLNGGSALGSEDARLAPDGRTLWVVDTKGDALSAFAVRGGDLFELPGSPTALPAGAAPFGVVVN